MFPRRGRAWRRADGPRRSQTIPLAFRRERKAEVSDNGPHRAPVCARAPVGVALEFVDAGGMMSYGPSFPDMFRHAAMYVDKLLHGAKAADLPVEQPTRFELVVDMKTARSLGVTIPQSILVRAESVSECQGRASAEGRLWRKVSPRLASGESGMAASPQKSNPLRVPTAAHPHRDGPSRPQERS